MQWVGVAEDTIQNFPVCQQQQNWNVFMHLGSGIKVEDCGRNGGGSAEVINLSEPLSPPTQHHLSDSLPPASLSLLPHCFPPVILSLVSPKEVNTTYGAGRSGTQSRWGGWTIFMFQINISHLHKLTRDGADWEAADRQISTVRRLLRMMDPFPAS